MPEETKRMFRVTINAPVQAVWEEITRTDKPILCFFNSRMHVGAFAPGSRLAMRSANGKYTGVVGEITEYRPPTRFAHTFKITNYNDPPCKVIYDLKSIAAGTEFTLTIEDLPVGTKTAKQMLQGGKMIVNTLKRVMESGRPSFGIRLLYGIMKVCEPLTPGRCRSEHWPVA